MTSRDTIAAIATAPGRAGIGVVRLSGAQLLSLAQKVISRPLLPRCATRTSFIDAQGQAIDDGIALYFPAPNSYTGEDVLELQGHGGPVVQRMVLQRCVELGARIAAPGEFTRRAFLNGKLDLAQSEAVIDLIDASTAQAARSALRSLHGAFSLKIQELNAEVIELRARVEAALDFPEEDIDVLERASAQQRLGAIRATLDGVLEAARQGRVLREGMHIAIAGQPNVGKSSLLNRLSGDEVAIVTDVPGTTRDPIRQLIDLAGVPVHIVDTAGLRTPTDPVERIGVERAWGVIGGADAIVLVVDSREGLSDTDRAIVKGFPPAVPRIYALNKIDLTGEHPRRNRTADGVAISFSAKTGAGLDLIKESLLELAGWQGRAESVFLARERHLEALRSASEYLQAAARQTRSIELFAEELRLAQKALGQITGEYTADDLLGEIFSRFCIGK